MYILQAAGFTFVWSKKLRFVWSSETLNLFYVKVSAATFYVGFSTCTHTDINCALSWRVFSFFMFCYEEFSGFSHRSFALLFANVPVRPCGVCSALLSWWFVNKWFSFALFFHPYKMVVTLSVSRPKKLALGERQLSNPLVCCVC